MGSQALLRQVGDEACQEASWAVQATSAPKDHGNSLIYA